MMDIVVAFDLGGTNLRFAVVNSDGEILSRQEALTPNQADAGTVIDLIVEMANSCREQIVEPAVVTHVAGAVPAIINEPLGLLTSLPNLHSLDGTQLRDLLAKRLRLPVTLINDASAAALGEHWLGASRDVNTSLCITIGTGIGGGIVIDGRSYRGADGTAGEIGHICVEPDGHPCGCGSNGCVEQYASATAIVRIANSTGLPVTSARAVYEKANAGDVIALNVFKEMGKYLGIAIADLVNVFNPEMIIIAGGVSSALDHFIQPLREEAAKRSFQLPWERVKIVPAQLGDNAGILGAARAAFVIHS